ncbi:orotidine 5'-phosphate decarboxylase / HUMPS family protein, partial [Staphylococcus aureus]|uniref:orotidine 5'-phosphate decarboxylase / HUMPS family protein n=1 Tax=Staphylococcus aureus TaxID=1280 RepID=UPI00210B3CC9
SQSGLYSNGLKQGQITITMNDGTTHTIDLSQKRAKELDEMGADYIAVHTGYDLQAEGQSPLESLRTVKSVIKTSKVAVAGGIKPDTIKEIVAQNPDLVIVGGGIANADDTVEAAKHGRAAIEGM